MIRKLSSDLPQSVCDRYLQAMGRSLDELNFQIFSETNLRQCIYLLLILVEFLQMLFFSVYDKFQFLWASSGFELIQSILKYFQSDFLAQQNTPDNKIVLGLLIIASVCNFLPLSIYAGLAIVKGQPINGAYYSGLSKVLAKFLALYIFVLDHVLLIPFAIVYLGLITCRANAVMVSGEKQASRCYNGAQLAYTLAALVGFINLGL